MIIVRQVTPKPVFAGLLAWSVVLGACAFVWFTAGHSGIGTDARGPAIGVATLATVVTGIWLGVRHRTGTAFAAPVLAWIVLVPFAFASGFVTSGVIHGAVRGLAISVFGGFVIATLSGLVLVACALLGRAVSGSGGDDAVVIYPPEDDGTSGR